MIKWNNESVKEALLQRGFELLEEFKGRIILDHHMKCLKCGNAFYMDGTPYKKSINDALNTKSGCPFCSGKYASKTNNLQRAYPDIVKHWDFDKNDFLPYMYAPYARKKVYVWCPVCGISKQAEIRSISQNKSCKCQGCTHKYGTEHWNYNAELTDEEREAKRDLQLNTNWRNDVYRRDNYTCQICGKAGTKLNAHHLDGYSWCKEKRFDISNGVTMCENCHKTFHKKYGLHNNTKEQYEDFKKSAI